MSKIGNLHDSCFKSSMADIRVARDFLEGYLPSSVLSKIDLSTLRRALNSYVNEELHASNADVLYEVEFLERRKMYFCLLLEHQSRVDVLMPYRLFRYMVHIWGEWLKQKGGRSLPLVYPVVFYHGSRPYDGPRRLSELIDAPPGLVEEVLGGPFHLVDTHEISDEELRERRWAGPMTFLMKHVREQEASALVEPLSRMIGRIAREDGAVVYAKTLLEYWAKTGNTERDTRALIEAIRDRLPDPIGGELMTTIAEKLIEQGLQQGRQEGMQEGLERGVKEGEKTLLMRQLQIKFGLLPLGLKQRIESAAPEDLLMWGERVLSRESLEKVFSDD